MKIEKGCLIFSAGIWYVIVNIRLDDGKLGFDCICDHANNIHFFELNEVECLVSRDEMRAHEFGNSSEIFREIVSEREIPFDVIASVLMGHQDKRFDHWHFKRPNPETRREGEDEK